MEEQMRDMSPQSLRRVLIHNLKSKGILQELKANLRQKLVAEMQFKPLEHSLGAPSGSSSLDKRISYSLCLDYLRRHGYSYTLSVLVPEAGLQNHDVFSRDDLIAVMRLNEFCKNNQLKFLSLSNPNASLLDNITSYLTSFGSTYTENKCIQVGLGCSAFPYEIQLKKIDAKYEIQKDLDVEQVKRNFEGKILRLRGEIEEEVYSDYCKKLDAFKRTTLNEMKDEIELSANAKIKEKQLQLEEVYAIRKAALDEREKCLNEAMAKSRESSERANFLQKQTLAAEMEACRISVQKARQAEADLERQRTELQDEFCRRRAQLQTEEQELLVKKQEFDDIVRQEVERLRMSDEVELLSKRKELEFTKTRLAIEKSALEAQRDHILALQEEVSQKSALFSQMEITDYKTLQLKLGTSTKEINALKESLGQALKELEELRQGAATAASERSLLVATRQENESLRTALEQERAAKNKERINLTVRIEELKEEKSRLEERVCLQESEVSRLRGRLADQLRARPSDARVYAATATPASANIRGDFCGELQTPAVFVKNGSMAASSATVKTAQERLKALEQESVELEEALVRWKEEISTVSPISKMTTEAVAKRVQPNFPMLLRSGLSTAYLNSFRTATGIPLLGQFPPGWPLPFMSSMAGAVEAARDGTCGETPDPVGALQHFEREVSASVQQPRTAQTSEAIIPLQADTVPRITTPVATGPSADIPINYQKGSAFMISKRSPSSSIPATSDGAKKAACEVPERQSSANHSDDTPLIILSQSGIQNGVVETVGPVDQGTKESSPCKAVPLGSSDRRVASQSTEKVYDTHGLDSNSPECGAPDSLTGGVGGRRNDSSTKQVNGDKSGEEDKKHFVEVSPYVSQKEEKEMERRSDSSSNPEIDPMILKYMKVVQEQHLAQESGMELARPVVAEHQDSEATEPRPSFGDFLSAQQFDSDLSSDERKVGDISIEEPIEEKSEEYNNSDSFW